MPLVVAVNLVLVGLLSVQSPSLVLVKTEPVEVARQVVEVVHQMRTRQRNGLDLCSLLVLAVMASASVSVAAIAVAVEQLLLQPVAAVA